MKRVAIAVSLCISLIASSQVAYAYDPPLGIPDPGSEWGDLHPIDDVAPAIPDNWNSEVAGFYYIDASNGSATNSNNSYGYPGRPRSSVPSSVPAGSYIEIHGNYDSSISANWACTEAAPCWLRGESAESMARMSNRLSISSGSYIFVENLEFYGGSGGAVTINGRSHHIVFRNSRLVNKAQPGGNSSGIGMNADSGQTVENIVIYGNHLESLGDWQVTEDLDFHGINPTLWGRDSSSELRKVWILNNYCTHLSGDCVQVNAGNWGNAYQHLHHVYIGHNRSYQNRQSGFWVKQASDVIISQNESWGSDGNGGANAGSAMGMQYEKHNVWFIFNDLHDSVFGIRQSSTSGFAGDVYILGNLIYNIRPAPGENYDPTDPWSQGAAIALWHGVLNRYIVDNTMHDVHDGVTAIYNGGVELHGNIISQKDDHNSNHFFDITLPSRSDNVTMDYNLFLDEDSESYLTYWGNAGIVNSLSRLQSVSGGECMNCATEIGETGSNHFVDVERSDFRLKPDSSAVGASVKHPAYEVFRQRYGIDIYVDYNGNPRSPLKPSIGAHEYDNELSRPERMPPPQVR